MNLETAKIPEPEIPRPQHAVGANEKIVDLTNVRAGESVKSVLAELLNQAEKGEDLTDIVIAQSDTVISIGKHGDVVQTVINPTMETDEESKKKELIQEYFDEVDEEATLSALRRSYALQNEGKPEKEQNRSFEVSAGRPNSAEIRDRVMQEIYEASGDLRLDEVLKESKLLDPESNPKLFSHLIPGFRFIAEKISEMDRVAKENNWVFDAKAFFDIFCRANLNNKTIRHVVGVAKLTEAFYAEDEAWEQVILPKLVKEQGERQREELTSQRYAITLKETLRAIVHDIGKPAIGKNFLEDEKWPEIKQFVEEKLGGITLSDEKAVRILQHWIFEENIELGDPKYANIRRVIGTHTKTGLEKARENQGFWQAHRHFFTAVENHHNSPDQQNGIRDFIISVGDTLDAILNRPVNGNPARNKKKSLQEAATEILKFSGTQLDQSIVTLANKYIIPKLAQLKKWRQIAKNGCNSIEEICDILAEIDNESKIREEHGGTFQPEYSEGDIYRLRLRSEKSLQSFVAAYLKNASLYCDGLESVDEVASMVLATKVAVLFAHAFENQAITKEKFQLGIEYKIDDIQLISANQKVETGKITLSIFCKNQKKSVIIPVKKIGENGEKILAGGDLQLSVEGEQDREIDISVLKIGYDCRKTLQVILQGQIPDREANLRGAEANLAGIATGLSASFREKISRKNFKDVESEKII